MLTFPCVWFFRGALDHITVTTKDGKFPLNQLGQISQKSPQLIVVNMTNFPEVRTRFWRHGKGRYLPWEQTGWYWAKKQVDKSSHTGQGLRAQTTLSLLGWHKLCFAADCAMCLPHLSWQSLRGGQHKALEAWVFPEEYPGCVTWKNENSPSGSALSATTERSHAVALPASRQEDGLRNGYTSNRVRLAMYCLCLLPKPKDCFSPELELFLSMQLFYTITVS